MLQETTAVVTVHDESRHGLEDGDYVTIDEVEGMTQINGTTPLKVTVTGKSSVVYYFYLLSVRARTQSSVGPYTFRIEVDTTQFGAYERGGIVTQVKMPKKLNFV